MDCTRTGTGSILSSCILLDALIIASFADSGTCQRIYTIIASTSRESDQMVSPIMTM
ncbi:hypothetical protein KC19_6G056500 [Ceratodon purpureus]|uniref:Uncharacterized protein n=1 Tax=Ceratodon purpureus TaxID=3225 RepID=A0A8T0HI23_CERPU|nr:hypothetical protein KC19_6G056500 [Ceratodon purpureus]